MHRPLESRTVNVVTWADKFRTRYDFFGLRGYDIESSEASQIGLLTR